MYPNSLFRLLATAVSAFPPPYLFLKSALTRSRKAIDICLPTDSLATTQYAAIYRKPKCKSLKYSLHYNTVFHLRNCTNHQISNKHTHMHHLEVALLLIYTNKIRHCWNWNLQRPNSRNTTHNCTFTRLGFLWRLSVASLPLKGSQNDRIFHQRWHWNQVCMYIMNVQLFLSDECHYSPKWKIKQLKHVNKP